MDSMIAPGYLNSEKISAARRNSLKTFAEAQSQLAKNNLISDLDAFVAIAGFASIPFSGGESPHQKAFYHAYLEDLRRVLVGDGFSNTERNNGTHALKFMAFRDKGFKKKFQDGGNQVQHAMAGIYISALYPGGKYLLRYQEDEPADLALYEAAFEIESRLNERNFHSLPVHIKTILGG